MFIFQAGEADAFSRADGELSLVDMGAHGGEPDALTARLALVARTTTNSVLLLNADGRIEWANDAFTATTGYTRDEALGLLPCELMQHPETDLETLGGLFSHIVAGQGHRCEIMLAAKSGQGFWVAIDMQPTFDAQGRHDGFISVQTDITYAKTLEARLKATTSSLRSAGELARLGAWNIDIRNRVAHWSAELLDILGRREAPQSIDVAMDIYAPDERARVTELMRSAIQSGERVEFDARATGPQGEDIWLRVIGVPEIVDGRCVAVHGASQDITAQRLAHAGLLESERFGRGVIDGVAAMLTVIDVDGHIIAANEAFRTTGARFVESEAYPLGRNLFDALATLPGAHGRALTRGLRAVLSGERESFIRAYQAGSHEWYRVTASRFAGDGPVRCVVVTQSIEDVKRNERRLRKANDRLKRARDDANAANLAKSAFLATMSHEIRTPLNGVLGMAQAMANDALTPVQRGRLTVVRQAGETLLALLNDLLDLSRIEAGRLDLEDGVIELEPLLDGVKATFTTLATEKDISLRIDIAPEARGCWRGDPTRVKQILYNLISNAVKFTSHGTVGVGVRTGHGRLVFTVTDTGPGIAPDRVAAMFDKFVQADASTTRQYGGSGLGLPICRQLAELMGGEIQVRSRPDVGSVFTVSLPLERLPDGAARSPQPQEEMFDMRRELDAPRLRILAAEDNPMNRLVLTTLLAQVGLDIECVADGAEAIDAWAHGSWDAILMDVQMPVMDGPTATREIRAREAATGRPRTPIIALTANAMAHHQAEYLAVGMDSVVPKPLELERLVAAIQQAVEPSESEAETASRVA